MRLDSFTPVGINSLVMLTTILIPNLTVDVNPRNLLIADKECPNIQTPVVQGDISIYGTDYAALLAPQPIRPAWKWEMIS
jgi:hypothetical protein